MACTEITRPKYLRKGRPSTRDTVLAVKRYILDFLDLAERVDVLATVKDKACCRTRARGPP